MKEREVEEEETKEKDRKTVQGDKRRKRSNIGRKYQDEGKQKGR